MDDGLASVFDEDADLYDRARPGYPGALMADDSEAYERIVCRLILDAAWRQEMYERSFEHTTDQEDLFAGGDASRFADTVASLL